MLGGPTVRNIHLSPKGRLIGTLLFFIIVLDQATKLVVDWTIPLNRTIPVIDHFFNLTHIRNPGAAFGILAGSSAYLRWSFLVLFSLAAVVFIIFLLKRLTDQEKLLIMSLTFILGGALGNLIDRLVYGEVVDFLDFYWSRYHWPAFNVADSFITVGVILSMFRMIRAKGKDPFAAALALLVLFAFQTPAGAAEHPFFHGEDVVSVPANRVVNRDYFALGKLIEISGTVNGDVYAAGGQVLVDGTINGDLLAAGGVITISGKVAQNARIAGGQISISGEIGRNLTVGGGNIDFTPSALVRGGMVAAGGNIYIASHVGSYLKAIAGNLTVANRIGGSIQAAVGAFRLTSTADVAGDVTYMSAEEISRAEGAKIGGAVSRRAPPKFPRPSPAKVMGFLIGMSLLMKAVGFVSTLVLGLLSIRLIPNYHRSAVVMLRQRTWACLGIGFVTVVVVPVVISILMATVVGIPLGFIALAVFLVLLFWSRIFSVSWLGNGLFGLFRKQDAPGWAFFCGLIIYYLLTLIPVLGWLIALFVLLFGLGAELLTRKEVYRAARSQEIL